MIAHLTPSTPAVPSRCCWKTSGPYLSNSLFLILDIRALWRSVLKIKNGGLDQYGAELFEQQPFGLAGIEGVKSLCVWLSTISLSTLGKLLILMFLCHWASEHYNATVTKSSDALLLGSCWKVVPVCFWNLWLTVCHSVSKMKLLDCVLSKWAL